MSKDLNLQQRMIAKRKAYEAMLDSDWEAFIEARFSAFKEGNAFLIANLDLREVDFEGFKGNFVYFYECDIRGVNFRGHNAWPLAFEHCDMQEMDWRGQNLAIQTFECDMRGIKYDDETRLNWDKVLPSEINYSLLDDDFEDFLRNQGVKFDEKSSSLLEFT